MKAVRNHRAWLLPLALVACVGPDEEQERERVELANRIVELEQENARFGARVQELEQALQTARSDDTHVIVCPPPIDARVLTVHPDRKRILLDKGTRDGVELGFVFSVYSGKTYKGQVRVTEVDDSTSFAAIRSQKNPIAPGDSAATHL
jgi:cell shape-determining protein MreC